MEEHEMIRIAGTVAVNTIISIPGAKNNFMLGCQKIITNGSFQNEALKLQYELS